VTLRALGFEGDGVADKRNHGGVDKAICVYSLDHYPFWEKTLGIKVKMMSVSVIFSCSVQLPFRSASLANPARLLRPAMAEMIW
jgi:hypothetical protein